MLHDSQRWCLMGAASCIQGLFSSIHLVTLCRRALTSYGKVICEYPVQRSKCDAVTLPRRSSALMHAYSSKGARFCSRGARASGDRLRVPERFCVFHPIQAPDYWREQTRFGTLRNGLLEEGLGIMNAVYGGSVPYNRPALIEEVLHPL